MKKKFILFIALFYFSLPGEGADIWGAERELIGSWHLNFYHYSFLFSYNQGFELLENNDYHPIKYDFPNIGDTTIIDEITGRWYLSDGRDSIIFVDRALDSISFQITKFTNDSLVLYGTAFVDTESKEFIFLKKKAFQQVTDFPSCEDLKVTKMLFDQTTGKDTLYVTIYNDCDTCVQVVYTGVIVYIGEVINSIAVEDTLAIDYYYTSERSPDNNTERTYTAIVKKDFDLSQKNFKVGLLGVCDSIPLAPDVILGLKEESTKGKKKVFLQSNSILIAEPGQAIKDVSIYSLSGQLVQKKSGIFSSAYTLKPVKPGIYVVSVSLSNSEVVNLKYYSETTKHY